MKLSDLKCRKAKAGGNAIKLADGGGLYLHIYPNGKKLWRLAYRYGGKQRMLAFGPYPRVTLLDARKQRDAAKDLIREGKDPTSERRANQQAEETREANTFAAYADVYLDRLTMAGRAEATLKKSRWIVEDLAKELRDQQIADIRPRDVLRVLRVVEAKGNLETARRMKGVLSAVFRLAVIEDALMADPTAVLRGAILPPQTKHQAAITEPKEFGALLRVIDGYGGHKTIKIALQLLALTFPRPGELRQAEWPEVDIANTLWIIPPERTKMRREHRIPLSRQAVRCFEELKAITGRQKRCFPSIRSLNNPLSDGALNAALRALGVDGDTHVAHGFRSSASSILNEHSPFEHDVIERALAHDEPDKVRRAYNRAAYWDERVRMMQWWADYLDELKVKGCVDMRAASEPQQIDLFA
jgi:integrase